MRKLGLMLMVLSFWMAAHGEAMLGTAILVIDGNTFELKTDENETYKIILFGVDCPEPGQPFAEDAKNALEKLILRQKIAVDVVGKDRHGVRLGVVLIKNKIDPRKELLKDGLAWTAERDPQVELEALRLEAYAKRSGVWKENNPTPPWIYRREQSMLQPKSS